MNLVIPKHVAAAMRTQVRAIDAAPKYVPIADEIAEPIPEGMPIALFWRVHVIPVGIRSVTKGGLAISEKLQGDQIWNHGLGKIVGIGPLAFKGDAWKDALPEHLPKLGDIVLFNPKGPLHITRNGVKIHILNDDHISALVDPEHADGYHFMEGLLT